MVIVMNRNNRKANPFTKPKFLVLMTCIYFVIILGCDYLSEIVQKNMGYELNPHIVAPLIIALVTWFAYKAVTTKKTS